MTPHELKYGRDGLMPIELVLLDMGWTRDENTPDSCYPRTCVRPPANRIGDNAVCRNGRYFTPEYRPHPWIWGEVQYLSPRELADPLEADLIEAKRRLIAMRKEPTQGD